MDTLGVLTAVAAGQPFWLPPIARTLSCSYCMLAQLWIFCGGQLGKLHGLLARGTPGEELGCRSFWSPTSSWPAPTQGLQSTVAAHWTGRGVLGVGFGGGGQGTWWSRQMGRLPWQCLSLPQSQVSAPQENSSVWGCGGGLRRQDEFSPSFRLTFIQSVLFSALPTNQQKQNKSAEKFLFQTRCIHSIKFKFTIYDVCVCVCAHAWVSCKLCQLYHTHSLSPVASHWRHKEPQISTLTVRRHRCESPGLSCQFELPPLPLQLMLNHVPIATHRFLLICNSIGVWWGIWYKIEFWHFDKQELSGGISILHPEKKDFIHDLNC